MREIGMLVLFTMSAVIVLGASSKEITARSKAWMFLFAAVSDSICMEPLLYRRIL